MSLSSFVCDSCHRRVHEQPRRTMTGRSVCAACDRRLLGAAAGAMTAQREGTDPVTGAIATAGWLERIRASRRRRSGS